MLPTTHILDTTFECIMHHTFDQSGTEQTFAQRLAMENGWDIHYAERVVAEYRRFLYLMLKSNRPLTPSNAVDQAWHLHITYTRNYASFCAKVMPNGLFLHHEPSQGGIEEAVKFWEQYQMTLGRYQFIFGDAPKDIWENVFTRFGTPASAFVRINTLKNGVYVKNCRSKFFFGWFIISAAALFMEFPFASYLAVAYASTQLFYWNFPDHSWDNSIAEFTPSLSQSTSSDCGNCGGSGCGGG